METTIDNDKLEVVNSSQYINRINDFEDEDEESAWYIKNSAQVDLIGQIVATEVAIFLFRRTGGADFCASVINDMTKTRMSLITKYEKEYGEWMNFNKDVMY